MRSPFLLFLHARFSPMVRSILLLALMPILAARSPELIVPWENDLPSYQPVEDLSGVLHSVGADSMDVITFGWIREFRRLYPKVHVTMEARGSLTGAPALTAGLATVAPVARELLPSELNVFQQRFGYAPTAIRVAGGSYSTSGRTHALAIIVHKDNPLVGISLAELDAIYSTTRRRGAPEDIVTWGQLGLKGEWANRKVTAYGLRRPNGIVNFFQHRVMQGGAWKTSVHERESVQGDDDFSPVVDAVARDPGGIAYATFASESEAVHYVGVARESDGVVVPGNFENVLSHTYPLSRVVYLYVNLPPGEPLQPVVREFLRLVLSREGQRIVTDDGMFLPLPWGILEEELAKLEAPSGGLRVSPQAAGQKP